MFDGLGGNPKCKFVDESKKQVSEVWLLVSSCCTSPHQCGLHMNSTETTQSMVDLGCVCVFVPFSMFLSDQHCSFDVAFRPKLPKLILRHQGELLSYSSGRQTDRERGSVPCMLHVSVSEHLITEE